MQNFFSMILTQIIHNSTPDLKIEQMPGSYLGAGITAGSDIRTQIFPFKNTGITGPFFKTLYCVLLQTVKLLYSQQRELLALFS